MEANFTSFGTVTLRGTFYFHSHLIQFFKPPSGCSFEWHLDRSISPCEQLISFDCHFTQQQRDTVPLESAFGGAEL